MKTIATAIFATAVLSMLCGCNTNNTETSNSTNPQPSPSASAPVAKQPAGATKISVTEKDMVILLSANSAPSGQVDFVTTNNGPSPHEFLVVKTDLPPNKLPLKNGELDEKAKSIQIIKEIEEEDLKKGSTKTLSVNLTPGKYLLACNLPGHFKAGMFTSFLVK